MKKITLFLFTLITCLNLSAQVSIGSGEIEIENAPFEAYYGYSYTQTVYLSSEINASGTITDIQWYYSGTTNLSNSQELIIYMAESTRSEYASTTDWEPIASFTQVYAGGITVTAGVEGWVTLTLDTPFVYSGTDNLIIAVEENGDGYDTSTDDFHNSAVATNRTISYFNDSTNPDPATPPTANNIDDTIPNVILGGITQACPSPSDLTAINITTTSADLGWTENGTASSYNVEVVVSGDMPTETATDTGVANGFTKSGLLSGTSYDYYVQADCTGGELSAWVGPFTFTTECVAYTVPYSEDFDSTATGTTTNPTAPNCWSFIDEGAGYGYVSSTGANSFYIYNSYDSSGNYILVSPETTDLSSGNNRVTFDLDGSASQDFIVGTMTDPSDATTFTAIQTITLATSDYESYVVNIPVGTDLYLGFKHGQTGTYDSYYLDNIVVEPIPSCPSPSSLGTANLMPTEVDLVWTENGTASEWNIEFVDVTAGGSATGTATYTGVTANPYSVSGLVENNDYEFYVQADCGGEVSQWVGPYAFTTPLTPPDNDSCSGSVSLPIDGTVVNGTTEGATGAGGSTSCNGSIGNDVWYVLTGDGGDITVEVIAANEGAQIGIYESTDGTCTGFTEGSCFESVDDLGALTTDITFASTDGTTYYVNLGAWISSGDDFPFTITATSSTLSTPSFENNSSFTYFPNPVKNTLTLNAQNTIENVTMYNMLGQEVLRATPNAVNSELNMSNLQDGAYFVKVTIANVTKTIKVIKQ